MAQSSAFELVRLLVEVHPTPTFAFARDRTRVAANAAALALEARAGGGDGDPWRLGSVSLDALLHRVLSGPEERAWDVDDSLDARGASRVEASRLRLPSGEWLALVTVTMDDQDRARDRDALPRREAVSKLLPGMAHELRGPLTAISGIAQILNLAADVPEDCRRGLEIVQGQVTRADGLLRNLVAFARGPRHDADLPVALNDVVRRALELLAHDLRGARIEVAEDLSPDLPLIAADPEDLLLPVVLLLAAAIDSLSDGRLKPDLRLRSLPGEDRQAVLRIEFRAEPSAGLAARSSALLSHAAERAASLLDDGGGRAEWRKLADGSDQLQLAFPGWSESREEPRPGPRPRVLLACGDLGVAARVALELGARGVELSAATSQTALRRKLSGNGWAATVLSPELARTLGAPPPGVPCLIAAPASEKRAARAEATRLGAQSCAFDDIVGRTMGLLPGGLGCAPLAGPRRAGAARAKALPRR